VPDPRSDIHWPVGSGPGESWLAELTAGVRVRYEVRDGQGTDGVPEVLAAGFTHREAGLSGAGFAGGGAADRLVPGPALADFTAAAWAGGLAARADDEVVGVLCAWRRLASWATAGELAAVTELAGRRTAADPRAGEHFDAEIAAALTLTGRSASRVTGLAAGLARLPEVAAALAGGLIDGPRAAVIADETCLLDEDAAVAVADRVLAAAPGQTTGQLRAACRRAVLAADPQAAIRRREQAQRDARVEAWTETSGTGALAGRDLPPAEMIAADQRIDALARWLKDHGAAGTLGQLRARVFTALLAGRAVADLLPAPAVSGPPGAGRAGAGGGGGAEPGAGLGSGGPGRPADGRPAGMPGWAAGMPGWAADPAGWPAGLSGSVNLTMPLTAWLGLTGEPGEAAGAGPLDAGTCRDLADLLATRPGSRWCVTLTGPDGRAVAHGCARAGPGPAGASRGSPGASRGSPGASRGSPGAGPGSSGPGPPGGALAWLSVIKIQHLAAGKCAHPRETPGYRPSNMLRHLIKIRDRTCSFPGCRRQAVRCDDDHTTAYEQGGRTCECNLSPLCRRHHRAKQATGWRLDQPEPGVLIWTAPHGRSYQVTPDPYLI
jgi:hypothetical protein